MTTNEIKKTLFQKLQAENSSFTLKDISARTVSKAGRDSLEELADKEALRVKIVIRGYEHIRFFLSAGIDCLGEYFAMVTEYFGDDFEIVSMADSRKAPPVRDVLIDLGYHIANTF